MPGRTARSKGDRHAGERAPEVHPAEPTRSGLLRGWRTSHVTLIFFGTLTALIVSDAAERIWVAAGEGRGFHVARIIIASILGAVVVVWAVSMAVLPLLVPESSGTERRPWPANIESPAHYSRWFIHMRWIAVVIAATLITIAVQIAGVLPKDVWQPLLLTVATLAGFNVLFTFLARRPTWAAHLLLPQIYVDLIILALLLHFSGGIENPLALLLYIHVILAGILLPRWQSYGVAAAASALFAMLVLGEWAGFFEHHEVLTFPHMSASGELRAAYDTLYVASITMLQSATLFLVAYFVTTLAERSRSHRRELETMAARDHAGRQLLEQALATTGTALRVVDSGLRTRWMNDRWKEWFCSDCERDQCLPRHIDRIHAVLGVTQAPREHRGAVLSSDDGRIFVSEVALPCVDHAPPAVENHRQYQRTFRVTTAPILNGAGRIQDVVELAQDITEQKHAETQMMRAAKLAAVGELAGHVAHEVNNPIAIISAKGRLLLADHRDEMSAKTTDEIAKIVELADRVARIAQGLLSYCRPSPATRTLLDIRGPIRKALSMIEQRARTARVILEDGLNGAIPPVRASAHELEEIFLNLFLNALDAMPSGGTLRIRPAEGPALLPGYGPCVAIVVEDTGTGVPEHVRGQIFEPFFTTKEEGKGTGLGLSICLGLVRSHGGEIEVESDPGCGARFVIRLPIGSTAEAAEQLHHA